MNEKIWKIILNFPQWTYRSAEQNLGVSAGTLCAWKNGKHTPRKENRYFLLQNLSDHLSDEEKTNLFQEIMCALGVNKCKDSYTENEKKANENFYSFLRWALEDKLFNDERYNQEGRERLLWDILIYKFKSWFSSDKNISVDTKKIGGRIVFLIFVNEPGKETQTIVFSHLNDSCDLIAEENSIKEFSDEYGEKYLVHIAVTLAKVSDKEYLRFLHTHNVYLKRIQSEDFKIRVILNEYFCPKDRECAEEEHKINIRAEIIFRKFLESSYLIYKEILCSKYDVAYVNSNFFESNLGIGNYPYAMRRAISFEKKQIENKLKEMRELRNDKIDLLIDLNCLGGLYGLRLSRYAKQVLCVDASRNVLNEIKRTVRKYNKKVKEDVIANVETELFWEDTCDILTNRNLTGKADCVIVGLGTMSYIKSPELLLRKIGTWLNDDGAIFLSCYNQDALSVQLKKYENLSYEYDPYRKRFIYAQDKINIPVPIKMYSFSKFKNIIINHFDFEARTTWSYPTLSSIFPINEYDEVFETIKEVDKVSALQSQYHLANGNYNMIMARNYRNVITSDIYMRTKGAMMNHEIMYQAIQHPAFVSQKTLFEGLKEKGFVVLGNFIKTIIIKDFSNAQEILYYMIVLPFENRFKWDDLKLYYAKGTRKFRKTKVRLCTEKELRNMGFAIGCICPFTYSVLKEEYRLELMYDRSINYLPHDLVYTYSGRNDITLELKREELLRYLEKMSVYFY